MAYRYLWTPLALGPVTVRNRIVFSAHLTNYAATASRPSSTPRTTRPAPPAAPG